jgi:O-antigen/teichoic acid export membrane protein
MIAYLSIAVVAMMLILSLNYVWARIRKRNPVFTTRFPWSGYALAELLVTVYVSTLHFLLFFLGPLQEESIDLEWFN